MEPDEKEGTATNLPSVPDRDEHKGNLPIHIGSAPLLTEVMEALYDSGINAGISIQSFWDSGWHWRVSLGDELHGFAAEEIFSHSDFKREAARWLIETARKQYPKSVFAEKYAPQLREEVAREIGTKRALRKSGTTRGKTGNSSDS
jgi:hypothetical protein